MSPTAKLKVPVTNEDHSKGLRDAPITLVEYGDYECLHCGSAFSMIHRLEANFDEDLRFVYRHFPLSQIHPNAWNAAKAAEAAAMQNRFWAMHDMLYWNQDNLSEGALFRYAEELGLDLETFACDFQSDRVAKQVHAHFMGGVRSKVDGTPTFYLNGHQLDWDGTFETIYQALESYRADRRYSFKFV